MAIFTDILEQGRTSGEKPGGLESRDWFRSKAQEVARINTQRIISAHREQSSSIVRPGFMYLYQYDPKHKETLPYYDMYPLVFPFQPDGDGFLGLNMHYLPHIYRAVLMDRLYDLSSSTMYTERTKLRMNYELLSQSSKYKYFKPCVKRYLYSHLRSKFLMIPSNEWDIALFLPLEKFQKSNKLAVYADSRSIIRKS